MRFLLLALALCEAAPAFAQSGPPDAVVPDAAVPDAAGPEATLPGATVTLASTDFTFRRVKAPGAGAGKRITVQIDPAEQAARLAASASRVVTIVSASPDPATPPVGDAFDWYWATVSPALTAAGLGRFEDAVAALDAGQVSSPRLQTLKGIADAHGAEILKATIGTRVSPALVLAVIAVESGGNAAALSPAGASGLMQLMPGTAARFGVTETTDPAQNIRGGVAYLDWLMGEFGNDAVLALAGYNAGEGAVMKNAGVPPYAETRGYVPKVLAAWKVARGLCRTPPDLPGDGCVFL
jgi:soluble lytic murein transglycosylase-like protein